MCLSAAGVSGVEGNGAEPGMASRREVGGLRKCCQNMGYYSLR